MAEVLPIDIRPEHWAIVAAVLRAEVPDREVWAFGSRATGAARRHSDLDLAVVGAEPLPIAVQARLAEAFSESDLPWKVDVLDWATTGAAFRRIVDRDKVVVQRAATAPATASR